MQALNLFNLAEKTKVRKMIKIADLKPINNLKSIFREIRDYFAGNVTGITRDEKIAQNIMLVAPTTHFVSLAQAILFRGAGFEIVWPQMLALVMIGSVLFVLSLRRFHKSLSCLA